MNNGFQLVVGYDATGTDNADLETRLLREGRLWVVENMVREYLKEDVWFDWTDVEALTNNTRFLMVNHWKIEGTRKETHDLLYKLMEKEAKRQQEGA
jgi:hypothetical protein